MIDKERFWEQWSENFPVSATYTDGTEALPEGVEFTRAGQTVFLSLEELRILTYGGQEPKDLVSKEDKSKGFDPTAPVYEYGTPYTEDWNRGVRTIDTWTGRMHEEYAREAVEDSHGKRILVRRTVGDWEEA